MTTLDTLQHLIDHFPEDDNQPFLVELRRDDVQSHTYGGLQQAIRELSWGLIARGYRKGDVIGLAAPGNLAWTAACLGALRAGAVVMPLDRQLGKETLSGILKDGRPAAVFADGEQAGKIKDAVDEAPPIFRTDRNGEEDESWQGLLDDERRPLPEISPQDRATLFYTSGTTGPPKGVPLSHGNLVFQLAAVRRTGLIAEGDRVLQPLPLHHVYPFVIGTLAPLSLGLTLVRPYALTGPQMVRALREGRATVLLGVPRLYEALFAGIASRFEEPDMVRRLFEGGLEFLATLQGTPGARAGSWLLRPLRRRFAPDLRIMASGGAPLDPALAARLAAMGWGLAVGYGLTETAPLLTIKLPGDPRHDSVGRPVEGVRLRLDAEALPDDDGRTASEEEGEILARGPNVFAGYHNLPEKTAEAFTEDGWYRTGDIGTLDAEGYLRVTGRVSTLIVTPGGENVQPDDIESRLAAHRAIREAGVLARDDGSLVAVVVPELGEIDSGDGRDPQEAVQDAVADQSQALPSYQHPTDVALTRTPLPRTRLGKIRRHRLAALYEEAKSGQEGGGSAEPVDVADMAAEDRRLLENEAARVVWDWLAERYRDRSLSPDTSPELDLGIDSMAWLDVTMEIRRRAGIELEEDTIARIATVRDLLEAVAGQAEAGETVSRRSPLENPEESLTKRQMRWLEPLPPFKRDLADRAYRFLRLLMRRLFELRVEGRDRIPGEGPFLIAPNHVSYFDAPALAAALHREQFRRLFWAGHTGVVFRNALLRYVSRLSRSVPIDPDKGVISSMAFGAAVLKRDEGLVWFPEGQRSPDGRLQPFKTGVGLLLAHRPVPVVPAFIRGTETVLPPGRLVPRRHPITVTFGAPLDPDTLEARGRGENHQERIAAALQDAVAHLGNQRDA